MNKPLRHLALVALVMFALLFGSTSYVQYFSAQSLRDNPLNSRTLQQELGRERGPILLADGRVVASSMPSESSTYDYQRVYGGDGVDPAMYSAVTGFFSVVYGPSGLEQAENSMLAGTDDAMFYRNLTHYLTGQEPPGAAVQTTINPAVQEAAWNGMGGQRGAAVALDPRTGEVLAMVSTPGFDPNSLASHSHDTATQAYQELLGAESRPLYNRAIGGNLYPPGSTFKLITAAAALESGQYTPETELDAPTTLELPLTTATIRNAGGAVCGSGGRATLQHSLMVSCNTSFAAMGMELGDQALREQAEAFGFDEGFTMPLRVTASSFPDELNAPQLAQSSIGQYEVRATPMQMAMVAAGIANDGVVMQPNLVSSVVDSTSLDVISDPSPREMSRAVSPETAQQLTEMMTTVVESGTGTAAQIPGVDVAGKTGSAQHAQGAAPHAWFTAFAPADDPQIAVAVVVESGGDAGSEASGGRVAGPIAKAMIEAMVNS
ncbi:peptidoglycan D,D-transpeptidase FtsI family protein [Sediminivirga luteola]|uniref:Cell division protein FtsI n=1 Tax=Sediminivirga luteola TaxID=1774748 RepID=A0A8J2TZ90_9MICO|nr:penicillin-binding protein 2 [Sediminivirga luteola]GGA19777.1 cell division protein FtsI [Sediminivirga luteola]